MKVFCILALLGTASISFAQDFTDVVKYCTSYKYPVIDNIGVTSICASTETKNLFWIEGVHASRYRVSRHAYFVTLQNKKCTLHEMFTKTSDSLNLYQSFSRDTDFFIYADKKNEELVVADERGHRSGDVEKVVCQDIK